MGLLYPFVPRCDTLGCMVSHVFEVWSGGVNGRMMVLRTSHEEQAVVRLDYLRRAMAANGFGGSAWLLRDGERYEPAATA